MRRTSWAVLQGILEEYTKDKARLSSYRTCRGYSVIVDSVIWRNSGDTSITIISSAFWFHILGTNPYLVLVIMFTTSVIDHLALISRNDTTLTAAVASSSHSCGLLTRIYTRSTSRPPRPDTVRGTPWLFGTSRIPTDVRLELLSLLLSFFSCRMEVSLFVPFLWPQDLFELPIRTFLMY